jgi:hypothetical protein
MKHVTRFHEMMYEYTILAGHGRRFRLHFVHIAVAKPSSSHTFKAHNAKTHIKE